MEKEKIKKEVSDWFYKKHYYCKDVDSMLTFTAQSVINEIVEFTEQRVKNNSVLDDVIKRFGIDTRVTWCKHPSMEFYIMEQKGKDVLICNTTNIEDDNYNDWWVDYREINVL